MPEDLFDAVYGCLIGGAIGDALGAPVEGWHWADIRERYGKVDRFLDFDAGYASGAGHVTDDSYLRHLLCVAIVEKGGRITPDDFARVLDQRMNPDRLWTNERLVLAKIRQGMNPWWETGRGNIPAGCASMCIAPIGIVNAGDPAQAYQDAFCVASVDQDGNNRDFAATFAAGVAAAFLPDATIETVIGTMLGHSDYLTRRALELALQMAAEAEDVDEFAERFHASPLLDWSWPQRDWSPDRHFCGNSIEFLSVAVAILRLCAGDPEQSMIEGASFGRDCDTIASCCGSVVGALHGASAINPEWIEQCERANADIFEELHGDPEQGFRHMASRLAQALKEELSRFATRAEQLRQLLE
ncbi:MAG: ADP-ribosylglycohydrolase family protein [Candidatus Brocadiaceae bacterium]